MAEEGCVILYTDGAARGNPGPGSWAFVATEGNRVIKEDYGKLGKTTNNVAEYNAIINGLKYLAANYMCNVTVVSDSQLAINQLKGAWKVKKEHLKPLHRAALELSRKFPSVSFVHSSRSTPFITRADYLANMALDELV